MSEEAKIEKNQTGQSPNLEGSNGWSGHTPAGTMTGLTVGAGMGIVFGGAIGNPGVGMILGAGVGVVFGDALLRAGKRL